METGLPDSELLWMPLTDSANMNERDNMKWRMFTDSIAKEILPFNTVKKQHLQIYCKRTYILALYNKVKDDILKVIRHLLLLCHYSVVKLKLDTI